MGMSRFQDNIEAELNDIDWSSIITKQWKSQ